MIATLLIWPKREYYELYSGLNNNVLVEKGDFEPRYMSEIIGDQNVTLVSVKDNGDCDAIREYCTDNGIEYVNVAG